MTNDGTLTDQNIREQWNMRRAVKQRNNKTTLRNTTNTEQRHIERR